MTKFTQAEIVKLYLKTDFPGDLKFGQMIKVAWWEILNKKKFYYFIGKINDGMQIKFAYEYANELK